ncbi:hypothetical protein EV1_023101 [Malus domestica]
MNSMRYHLCKLEWKDNVHTAEAECLLTKSYIHEKEEWVKEIKIMLDQKLLLDLDCLPEGDQDNVGSKATSRFGLLAGEGIPFQ